MSASIVMSTILIISIRTVGVSGRGISLSRREGKKKEKEKCGPVVQSSFMHYELRHSRLNIYLSRFFSSQNS